MIIVERSIFSEKQKNVAYKKWSKNKYNKSAKVEENGKSKLDLFLLLDGRNN